MNRKKSSVSKFDLYGPAGLHIVENFNSRLTRRMTVSRVGLSSHHSHPKSEHDVCLQGIVKMNFDLHDPIRVMNRIELDGYSYEFATDLQLSKAASFGVQMCSHESVSDMLKKVCAKFNILNSDRMQAYERELSVTQQEIFYRRIQDDEKPMEIFFLWRNNGERKSIAITDHDPNIHRYDAYTFEELEQRLRLLDDEFLEHIHQIHVEYQIKKNYIGKIVETKKLEVHEEEESTFDEQEIDI